MIIENSDNPVNRLKEIKDMALEGSVFHPMTEENTRWIFTEVEKSQGMGEAFFKASKTIEALTKKLDELKQFKDWANAQLDADGEAFEKAEAENAKLKNKLELGVKLEQNVITCREGEEIFYYKVKPGNRHGDVEFKTITNINIVGYRILPLEDFKELEIKLTASESKVQELEKRLKE